MRIISVKRGFASDHSSTSYEFLAVDKALGKKERAEVASLSRRADPTSRRVSFIYHVDGYDIPGGWECLMEKYYDVMYREDYDWWTLALAFNTAEERLAELKRYEFSGEDDLGVAIERAGKRAIIIIQCRIDMAYAEDSYDEDEYDEGDEEEEEEGGTVFVAEDGLLNLLVQIRRQIIDGDYRSLYAVWEEYGGSDYDDEFEIPVPQAQESGRNIVEQFRSMLA